MGKKSKINQAVGVIGLGYIGLPLTAALASVGYKVIGIDTDERKVKKLTQTYKVDIHEPGVNEILKRYKNRIRFTTEQPAALKECDAIFITVGTPIDEKNNPDFRAVDSVMNSLGRSLKKGHLIILKSTVVPGVTRKAAAKLEKLSGLKAGKDFHVVYCPERTLEGRAMKELHTLPKIIGGITPKSLNKGVAVIKRLGGKIIKVSSLEIAEMCKCVDNAYRVINIAFANEIGKICEKNGGDAYEIVQACNNAYPRTSLFLPGLGAGGPCLSKDPVILNYFAKKNNLKTKILNASIIVSQESTMRLVPLIHQFIRKNKIRKPKISLVGLAFKGFPTTDDIRNSPAVDLYNALGKKSENIRFGFYDPIIKNFLGNKTSGSLKGCLGSSNVVVFLTDHLEFKNMNTQHLLKAAGRPLLIVDCWHNLTNLDKIKDKKVQIFRIGDSSYLKS